MEENIGTNMTNMTNMENHVVEKKIIDDNIYLKFDDTNPNSGIFVSDYTEEEEDEDEEEGGDLSNDSSNNLSKKIYREIEEVINKDDASKDACNYTSVVYMDTGANKQLFNKISDKHKQIEISALNLLRFENEKQMNNDKENILDGSGESYNSNNYCDSGKSDRIDKSKDEAEISDNILRTRRLRNEMTDKFIKCAIGGGSVLVILGILYYFSNK